MVVCMKMDKQMMIKRMISPKLFLISLSVLAVIVILFMLFPDHVSIIGDKILILWILFAIVGTGLVVVTYNWKITGKEKLFLLLSGYSAAGFVIGVVLHNLFYALGTITVDLAILNKLWNILEGGFFLVAVIICPICLLAGIIGSLLLWQKIPNNKNVDIY